MIKRLLWLVVALVCVARSVSAQQGLQGYVVAGTGAQARIVLAGSAIVFHQLTWNVTGTVSSCTVALDTSADGVSWSAGNAIAGQTCTSNGQSALSTSAVFNFVRVNTTAFSGTGSVVITWAGYVATPGGLPSGCTSPGTGAITCTGTVAANALTSTTSVSIGSGASAAGATATGGFACVEAASTGWTPTVGQDYQRCDSTAHAFVCSNNGAAEAACSPAPAYPQTVSGMTSGGVLYGSSATQVSSSAALAAGALVVGGGAGAAPTTGNADCTFLVHTLACGAAGLVNFGALPAAGLIIPKIAAGGTGSTSGAIQYSTDFDGYVFGANGQRDSIAIAALGGNATTNCASTNQVFTLISAQTAPVCSSLSAFVTSDYTNATTSLSNVTGLAVPLAANVNYAVSCKLIYQGSAATASMVLSSTGPASPTKVSAQNTQTTTNGAGAAIYSAASDGTTFAFTLGPTAIVTTATDLPSTLDIGIMNGANTGTFQLQAKSNGAGTVTIKQGSFCKWQ